MSGIKKRSIVIGKHKTSFSLEEPFLGYWPLLTLVALFGFRSGPFSCWDL
jgi:predicted DNA-binding ribbon-helix-helix protein